MPLPTWTIRPNWKQGVLERLEFLTEVLTSSSGVEQRRALRLSPRRSFEFTVNPVGPERSFLDLWLHRMTEQLCNVPLWHDKGRLSAPALVGATVLAFDNTFREHAVGGLAILYASAFDYEVVEIDEIDDGGLTLVEGTTKAWPKGTAIYPLREAWMRSDGTASALTSRVGEMQVLFSLEGMNDYTTEIDTGLVHEGRAVIRIAPNRASPFDLDFVRQSYESDSQTGRRYRADDAGRAFTISHYNWQARGREAHHNLRAMIYGFNGRQKSAWMPTFNDDMILARPAALAANNISIREIGYEYTGEVTSGRDRIFIGGEVLKISGTGAPLGAGEERLTLVGPTTAAHPAGRCGSFLDVARMDQDTVEIHHHTDSDGMCEATAAFRTFKDERVVDGPIYYPIPISEEALTLCGEPDDDGCLNVTPFAGWHRKARLTLHNPTFDSDVPFLGFYCFGYGRHLDDTGGVQPEAIVVPFQYMEFTWWNLPAAAEDPDTLTMQVQWSAGQHAHSDFYGVTGTFKSWKWYENPNDIADFVPTGDSDAHIGSQLRWGQIFPYRWFFNVD